MDTTNRLLLGFIMGVIMLDKIEVSGLPQYTGEVDRMTLQDDQVMDKRKGFDSMSGFTFGKKKRNFDEIDRAGFGAFVKRSPTGLDKRNFDEIDRAGFGAFVKRNFDEIDKVGFGSFNRQF